MNPASQIAFAELAILANSEPDLVSSTQPTVEFSIVCWVRFSRLDLLRAEDSLHQ
jgi:hypothetical protein